ncbi:hypothetical protein EAF04_000701 [Stromatinia cepivora]|nr:hypothetical protein EAF04_000701 [Stromatinia cepivora]
MAPRGSRKQFQRGEEVLIVGDANNHAFNARAVNSRKRSTRPQPSIEHDLVEIEDDDEPPRKSRPDPHSSTAKLRAPKQEERPTESRQESEVVISPEVIACPNLSPRRLLQPFADKDADVYIVLIQKSCKYAYRMHSHILKRASSWFWWELQQRFIDEVDSEVAARITEDCGIKYRFEIRFDASLKHHVLKRTGLTMYKKQPQAITTRAICTFDSNGHSLPTNSASQTRQSSLFLPQYDGSFDDVEMGNMAGGLEAAPHLDIPISISLSGTLQPSPQNPVNGLHEEDSIKSEEDTAIQLGSAELTPQTRKAMADQVATPPSSPTKAGAGTDTDYEMSENSQVYLSTQISPEEYTTTPLETPIKAEVGPEEQIFSENLPIAQSSPERQLEIANANDKIDEQCQPKLQPNQFLLSHQGFPEEQLQATISTENSIEPEIKVEETQQVTRLMSEALPTIGTSLENQIDAFLDANMMIEEPQQDNSQTIQVRAAHVSPAREIEAPADASLRVEGPKEAPRLPPQVSLGVQELLEKEVEVRTNGKSTAEERQRTKLDQIMEESSFDNHSVTKVVLPATEKPGNNTPNQKPVGQQATAPHPDVLETYHSLFLCYYNCPPAISTADVSNAMRQSNLLIKVATLYDSLKIVRPHIIASLLSQGRDLYSAIRQDPPRFLILAAKLQCTPIFKEAFVHIVGQFPSWPWPTPQDRVDPTLGKFIEKKTDDLQKKKHKVTDALFQSCLVKDGVRVSINNLEKTTFDLWVMVQIWHDWFSQQLHKCAHARLHEHASVEKNMYRLLAQGGDAYLKIDDVMSMVEPFKAVSEAREWGHWEKDQVELQLNIMKGFAAKKVKDLMVNELMGDSSGVDSELAYLTCTKVDEYELPWAVTETIED